MSSETVMPTLQQQKKLPQFHTKALSMQDQQASARNDFEAPFNQAERRFIREKSSAEHSRNLDFTFRAGPTCRKWFQPSINRPVQPSTVVDSSRVEVPRDSSVKQSRMTEGKTTRSISMKKPRIYFDGKADSGFHPIEIRIKQSNRLSQASIDSEAPLSKSRNLLRAANNSNNFIRNHLQQLALHLPANQGPGKNLRIQRYLGKEEALLAIRRDKSQLFEKVSRRLP